MEITRKRGDTSDTITIRNRKTQAIVNLTGCTFKLSVDTLLAPPDTSTLVYELTGIVSAPTTGVVEFSPSLLQADQVGYFYYDIQMTDSFGAIHTLESGSYIYVQDITK